MVYRTGKHGKVYKTNRPSSKINKQNETAILKTELKKQRARLRKLKRQEVAKKKEQAKNQAIREAIQNIKKEQSLLNKLYSNRISPEKAEDLRHGSRKTGGANYVAIHGLVNQ